MSAHLKRLEAKMDQLNDQIEEALSNENQGEAEELYAEQEELALQIDAAE